MAFNWLRSAAETSPARQAAAPSEAKASAVGAAVAWATTGRAAWSPRDSVSLARNGFGRNVIGFRCVRMVAEAAAAVPMILSDGVRRLDVHPAAHLLERPNPGKRPSRCTVRACPCVSPHAVPERMSCAIRAASSLPDICTKAGWIISIGTVN